MSAVRSLECLVERGERGEHLLRCGEGLRLIEHVVADEKVQVADVLHRLGLAQQRQRRPGCTQPDASASSRMYAVGPSG